MKLRNVLTALKHPNIANEYAQWEFQKQVLKRPPTKTIAKRMKIGGFCSFSEYYSVDKYLRNADVSFFESSPSESGAIIDIGANLGVICILLAQRYPSAKVYAFEPNPKVVSELQQNVALNDINNIEVNETAIADTVGHVSFHAEPVARATAGIALIEEANTTTVPCDTIDNFVQANGIEKISLMKIDVEGFETLVFRGAKQTLAEIKPELIYFEVCPKVTEASGFSADEPAKILVDAGYSLFQIRDDGELTSVEPRDARKVDYDNWVARPSEI